MIVKVVYKNGEVKMEDLSVDDAAIRLKTECEVQAIEFPDDVLNGLLEKKLAELLNCGFE